jgi:2-polyprenyl-3-methyl-5-hydroxy-6-metoxy-1,4-benzoquinol methylase
MLESKERSYLKQSQIFGDTSEEHLKLAETWFDESTADFWLHNRMYEAVDCISDKNRTWLTVGDGRWGLDSIRMRKRGISNVLPTDLCETLLKESKDRGYIESYSVENAEKLSFDDNSYDYVFCKESYHHFPRPYIALYEMLRVSSKAVFLVEPNDEPMARTVTLKEYIRFKYEVLLSKLKIRKEKPSHYKKPVLFPKKGYEESGNYVYSISKREAQKVLQGLDYPQMVYKEINTHYIKGCEFEPADVSKSSIFKKLVDTINIQDEKCNKGWEVPSLILLGLFKEKMDEVTSDNFKKHGFSIIDLPRNPYLHN